MSLILAVFHYEDELRSLDKPQAVDKELVDRVKKHYGIK